MEDIVKNYTVEQNKRLVASKDLSPGDVVLSLPPIAAGPGRNALPVCLGCLQRNETMLTCSKCSWPVCSQECEQVGSHAKECEVLVKNNMKFDYSKLNAKTDALDFIHPLRLLMAKRVQKDVANEINAGKVDLNKLKERNASKYGTNSDSSIIEVLVKFGFNDQTEILESIAMIERNNVPLDFEAKGVYPDLQKMTHSCSPNTYYIGLKDGGAIFRAAVNIKKGEAITYCRVILDKGNYFRRKLLKDELMDCTCPRCSDPTEFGTGYNCLICPGCTNGWLAPKQALQLETSSWECTKKCGVNRPGQECTLKLDQIQGRLSEQQAKGAHPSWYEEVLLSLPGASIWGEVPTTSQAWMDIRKTLIFTYQYHKDFYFSQQDWLRLKIDHCEAWLNLAEQLYPGFCYLKSLMTYENINAYAALIQAMKMDGEDMCDVNKLCYHTVDLCNAAEAILKEEEDTSLYRAIVQAKMIVTEAREEQKQRVYINRWADEEEEEW